MHVLFAVPFIVRQDILEIPLAFDEPRTLMLVLEAKSVTGLVSHQAIEFRVDFAVFAEFQIHARQLRAAFHADVGPETRFRREANAYVEVERSAAIGQGLKGLGVEIQAPIGEARERPHALHRVCDLLS